MSDVFMFVILSDEGLSSSGRNIIINSNCVVFMSHQVIISIKYRSKVLSVYLSIGTLFFRI